MPEPVALLPGQELKAGGAGPDVLEPGDEGLGQPRDPTRQRSELVPELGAGGRHQERDDGEWQDGHQQDGQPAGHPAPGQGVHGWGHQVGARQREDEGTQEPAIKPKEPE